MKRAHLCPTLLLLLAASACSVGPRYANPPVAAPPAYRENPPDQFKEAEGWKTAHPADAFDKGEWWRIFQDPELNQLESRISVSNETLKAAEARFRESRALVRAARSRLFPNVGAAPAVTGNKLSSNRAISASTSTHDAYPDLMLPVDVSYEIDMWGRVRRSIAATRAEAQATAADLETLRLSLHAELALDYFELRSLDAEKRLLEDTLDSYQKAVDLTRNRFDGGLASGAELAQARTQFETTRAQYIELGVQRAAFEHAIAVLTGKTPAELSLSERPLNATPPAIPVGLPSQLLERRPDVAAAERRVAAANEQVGVARTAFFPTLMLTATGGFEGGSLVNWLAWPSRFWAIGPSAIQTAFDAGRRRALAESAGANYEALVAEYRQATLDAFRQVEDSLSTLRILERESEAQRSAVEQARRALELAMNRYKGGLVTYLEVVSAQTIALANERTAVDLLRRRMLSSVLLIKALGGGWDINKLPQF
jgi:NodT family efflux transporter outer membrane factor (OMF) lipoprotein